MQPPGNCFDDPPRAWAGQRCTAPSDADHKAEPAAANQLRTSSAPSAPTMAPATTSLGWCAVTTTRLNAITHGIDPHQRARRGKIAPIAISAEMPWWRGRTACCVVDPPGERQIGPDTSPSTIGRARPISRLMMVTNSPGTAIAVKTKPSRTAKPPAHGARTRGSGGESSNASAISSEPDRPEKPARQAEIGEVG